MRGPTGEKVRLASPLEAGFGQLVGGRLAKYFAIVFNIVTLSLLLEPAARRCAIPTLG
jgi:hypothetical protein